MQKYDEQEFMFRESDVFREDKNDKEEDQTTKQSLTENNLIIESIRVKSISKQMKISEIWNYNAQQIQNYFLHYQLNDRLNIQKEQFMNSNTIKIIRDQHRIYFGEIVKNKKHGRGVTIYKDGKIYEGYYFQNQKQGLGYQVYQNTNVYIGEFQKNKKHGHGTMYWFNLSQQYYEYYDGEWWSGLPCGKGFHQRANGDIFEGEFKNGLKHGEGIQNFHNGDIYVGQYVNGFPEGYGEYIWEDLSSYKGDFKQGMRNGYGVWCKKINNQIIQYYKGYYVMDKRSGYGVYQWNQRSYYKGGFFDDKKHGYGQLYSNGKLLYSGMWQNGEKAEHLNVNRDNQLKVFPEYYEQFSLQEIEEQNIIQPYEFLPKIVKPITQTLALIPEKNSLIEALPKLVQYNSSQKVNKKRRQVDMDRLNRLALSKKIPKRCGHKNCIPEHEWDHANHHIHNNNKIKK